MGRRTAGGVIVVLVAVGLAVSVDASASASVEAELFGLVNGSRGSRVSLHSGLAAAAHGHSRQMSARGGLSHSGAASRIRDAAPDPSEPNGAPDDGYNGRYCENVAYVGGVAEGSVAQRIYQGWRNSPNHLRCMTSSDMNAGGIGVYFDGSRWWATLDLIRDATLPGTRTAGGAVTRRVPPPVNAEPAPTKAPAPVAPSHRAIGAPAPDQSPPTAVPPPTPLVDVEAAPTRPAAGRTGFGWPEILAGIGIASVSVFAYRRANAQNGRDR